MEEKEPKGNNNEEEEKKNIDVIVHGITCRACCDKVTNGVKKMKGIKDFKLNYMTQKGTISFNSLLLDTEKIVSQISKIGYQCEVIDNEDNGGEFTIFIGKSDFHTKVSTIPKIIKKVKCEEISIAKTDWKTGEITISFKDPNNVTTPRDIIKVINENSTYPVHMSKRKRKVIKEALTRKKEIKYHFWWSLISLFFTIPVFTIEVILLNIPSLNSYNVPINSTITNSSFSSDIWIHNDTKFLTLSAGLSYPIFRTITPASITLLILSTPVILLAGCYFYKLGIKAVCMNCQADKNTLISISTWMACFMSLLSITVGLFDEAYEGHMYLKTAGVLVSFLHIGALLDNISKRNTSNSLIKLMELQPKECKVLTDIRTSKELNENIKNGEKIRTIKIDVEELWRGDIIKIDPGESIVTDGTIIYGKTSIDQAAISGESIPVPKDIHDEVIGGTLNVDGSIFVRVTKTASENMLATIVETVENSLMEKTQLEDSLTKITKYYVPAVLLLAVFVYIIWAVLSYLVIPYEWRNGTHPLIYAILPSTSVLVTACPCALGIAIPIIVLTANGVGAIRGILFKGGRGLELLTKVKVFCFDKTGTLTKGKLNVEDIIFLDDYWKNNVNELLRVVGALESNVKSHPISTSLLRYVKEVTGVEEFTTPKKFQIVNGKGIVANLNDEDILIGNSSLMSDNNVAIDIKEKHRMKNKTIVYVAFDGDLVAAICLTDHVKPEAKWVINKLRSWGKRIVLLTGDNEAVGNTVGMYLNIDEIYCGLTPMGKEEKIMEIKKKGEKVLFMGDGINDSIALTKADVSVSISSGTEIAMECSDVVLMKDNLYYLIIACDLAKSAYGFMIANLFWAFFYNIAAFPVAAGVLYPLIRVVVPPWVCVIVMTCSNISVILSTILFRVIYKQKSVPKKLLDVYDGNKKIKIEMKEEVEFEEKKENQLDEKVLLLKKYSNALKLEKYDLKNGSVCINGELNIKLSNVFSFKKKRVGKENYLFKILCDESEEDRIHEFIIDKSKCNAFEGDIMGALKRVDVNKK